MKQWKSILLLGLVFFAGLAVGVVGARLAVRRAVQQAIIHPEKAQSLVEHNLTRRLRLDPGQQAQIPHCHPDRHPPAARHPASGNPAPDGGKIAGHRPENLGPAHPGSTGAVRADQGTQLARPAPPEAKPDR